MQDRQLYQQILGISSPWEVASVELKLEAGDIHVQLSHAADTTWCCAECGKACSLHDHQPERVWRHLDTCQYQTLLHAQIPRTNCPEHGVRTVSVPWALPGSRFTMLFEQIVISWLQAASQSAVALRMKLSWDEVHGIMDRAVKRGLERRQAKPLTYVGVDEKSFKKRHNYVTVVSDLTEGCVLYVSEDRKQSSLDSFWPTLTTEQLNGIQAVTMDMWQAYQQSVIDNVPDGESKIVFDKFHVAKHLGEAVDKVRRQENKELRAVGDDRLVKTRFQWLTNRNNHTTDQWRDFKSLRESNLKTARAWALREQAMKLFDYFYHKPAEKHFAWWYRWATRSRLTPMIEKAKMLKSRIRNILTHITHPITNALSESLNAKIQWAKSTARGFRNKQNFINAIYFHCGKLELDPTPSPT